MVLLWEGVGDRTELQHIDPHSYDHQRCAFLVLQGCSTGGPGAELSAECWLSLPHLVSNFWSPKLTDFLSSPSYIIVQSPTQYLWNGMFDRHQADIAVMQFTGHSLPVHQSMTIPWDFTLFHIVSQARLRDFFPWLPSECVTSAVFGMAGSKVNIQQFVYAQLNDQTVLLQTIQFCISQQSSSSSCRAASRDIPDPLSLLLPIVHRLWQVYRATSRILCEDTGCSKTINSEKSAQYLRWTGLENWIRKRSLLARVSPKKISWKTLPEIGESLWRND